MTNKQDERLQYLQNYFNSQTVKIEVPLQVTKDYRGNSVIHRFNGTRLGAKFVNNIAYVDKADVWKFEGQHFIIHDGRTHEERDKNTKEDVKKGEK